MLRLNRQGLLFSTDPMMQTVRVTNWSTYTNEMSSPTFPFEYNLSLNIFFFVYIHLPINQTAGFRQIQSFCLNKSFNGHCQQQKGAI